MPTSIGYEQAQTALTSVSAGQTLELAAWAPTGKKALGGGFRITDANGDPVNNAAVVVLRSAPEVVDQGPGNPTDRWIVMVRNNDSVTLKVMAYVVCAAVS